MELAVPCPICKLLCTCDCKPVLVSYFGLLERVHKRILSAKVTSNLAQPAIIGAGIDKLDIQFQTPVEIAETLEKANALGCEYKIVTLNNKRPYLRINKDGTQLHLSLNFHKHWITGLVSNPNKFGTWANYIHLLEQLFAKPTLHSSKIRRLDLNIDFSISFTDLIQQIDVRSKSTAISFDDKGGKRTGLNIGKKTEVIVIYDKAERSKLSTPHTRIENRLSGSKLKISSIYDLPKQLYSRDFFKNIVGTNLEFNESGLTEIQNQRLQEFRFIIKRDGLYSARKHMSKARNFERDFAKILNRQTWGLSPTDLFKQGIERFMGSSDANLKLVH